MNCENCLKANAIPNCYTGTVLITIGYLEAAYFSTNVLVKITNTATGKEILEVVATDGAGVVTFTAFNLMESYKVDVLDISTYQPLTIYTNETTDSVTSYSCCVEFETINLTAEADFSLNFIGCEGVSGAPDSSTCCVGVDADGLPIMANASNIDFVGFNVVDNGDGTVTVNHVGGGTGDVVGPAGATDGNIALYDGATGKLIKDSTVSGADVIANNAKVTNATHTGEVTGATVLTADKTIISNQADTVITASDYILFGDADDSTNLKKDTVQGIIDLVAADEFFITQHPIFTTALTWPLSRSYYVSERDCLVGSITEGNSKTRLVKDATLVGATLTAMAGTGSPATVVNPILVELYKNSTTLTTIDSANWIISAWITFVYNSGTGLVETAILTTDYFSIKCTSPAGWGGGTMQPTAYNIQLLWKVT